MAVVVSGSVLVVFLAVVAHHGYFLVDDSFQVNGAAPESLYVLKRFARVAGIAYFTFAFVNSAIFYYAPGARGRLRALLDADQTIFPWMRLWPSKPESQIDIVPILLLGGALGLILLAVPLYFLVTRKQAFEEAAQAL